MTAAKKAYSQAPARKPRRKKPVKGMDAKVGASFDESLPPLPPAAGPALERVVAAIAKDERPEPRPARVARTIHIPLTWWQHFKQDCLPKWVTDRWPVEYERVTYWEDASGTIPRYDFTAAEPLKAGTLHAGVPTWEQKGWDDRANGGPYRPNAGWQGSLYCRGWVAHSNGEGRPE